MQLTNMNKDGTRPKNAILLIYGFIHSNACYSWMSKNDVYFNLPLFAYTSELVPNIHISNNNDNCRSLQIIP